MKHHTQLSHALMICILLAVPRTKLANMGDCAFSSLGPCLWNKLPKKIRALGSLAAFKSNLKTHLFLSAFP